MPYVSSIERFAIKKGIKEGRAEGLRKGLLQAIALGLKLRFGPEGLELLPRVRELKGTQRLRAFLAAVHKTRDLADLRGKLPRS